MLKLLALLPIPLIVAALILVPDRERPAAPVAAGNKVQKLPSGWAAGKQQEFDKKTLFDRINGAAPPYIRAGFVRSFGADYRKPGVKEPVTVDAYDMGSAAQAFGMYATERDPAYAPLKVGDGGYLSTGSLNFWRGQYYFKLAGFEEGEEMDRGLTELAKDLAAAMTKKDAAGGAQVKAALAMLPDKREQRTEGYSLAPLAGIAGLSHAYYAKYKKGEDEYQLWLIPTLAGASVDERIKRATEHWQKEGAKISARKVKLIGRLKRPKAPLPSGFGTIEAVVAADGKLGVLLKGTEALAGGLDVPSAVLDEVILLLHASLVKADPKGNVFKGDTGGMRAPK